MISIIVPTYASGAELHELHARIAATLETAREPFELIFVEDGGHDVTRATLERLATEDPRVRAIFLRRNAGQHAALLCGIRAARGDTIVTLDDDLQHPPEAIPTLVHAVREGTSVVYGTAQILRHGPLRNAATTLTKRALQYALGAETAPNISAFRAFDARLRNAFTEHRAPIVNLDVLLTWSTRRFGAVAVDHAPRKHGRSGYTLPRLVRHAATMIMGFSTRPLRLASLVGATLVLAGGASAAYLAIAAATRAEPAPLVPLLTAILALFSGFQLVAIGILGAYLANVHVGILQRPLYVIEREIGATHP